MMGIVFIFGLFLVFRTLGWRVWIDEESLGSVVLIALAFGLFNILLGELIGSSDPENRVTTFSDTKALRRSSARLFRFSFFDLN